MSLLLKKFDFGENQPLFLRLSQGSLDNLMHKKSQNTQKQKQLEISLKNSKQDSGAFFSNIQILGK
jgi:hypothetical protein